VHEPLHTEENNIQERKEQSNETELSQSGCGTVVEAAFQTSTMQDDIENSSSPWLEERGESGSSVEAELCSDLDHARQSSHQSPSNNLESSDVRSGNVFLLLNAENAHEGDIEILDRFEIPFPDAGRPTQGIQKKRDDAKTSLVQKRKSYLQPNDMLLARVEYGQRSDAAQQPVSLFKVITLFKDRHRCATWMRVRWYGQEDDVFLGKYVEKKEKLTQKDLQAMERLRKVGKKPEDDIRFRITPDENLFLSAADGSNFVQGREYEPPLIVHWGKEAEILTKDTKKIRDTVVRLITTDVRLLNLPDLNIVEAVENARRRNKRKNSVSKKLRVPDSSSDSETSSSSCKSDSDNPDESSSSDDELLPNKFKRQKRKP